MEWKELQQQIHQGKQAGCKSGCVSGVTVAFRSFLYIWLLLCKVSLCRIVPDKTPAPCRIIFSGCELFLFALPLSFAVPASGPALHSGQERFGKGQNHRQWQLVGAHNSSFAPGLWTPERRGCDRVRLVHAVLHYPVNNRRRIYI